MAKISQLSTLTTVTNNTILPVVDTGVNYKITASKIKEYTNTSIPGANVSGTVSSATSAGTVTTNAQPNITSVGTLTSLTVTGNSTIDNVNLTGNIIPDTTNVYSLGNVTHYFKDAFIGPGSLYVNGKKVVEDVSGTINFTTDINQNLKITTSGSGDIQFDPTGTGVISIRGPLQIEAGTNITSSDGNAVHFSNPLAVDSITSHLTNTDLSMSANGTGTIKLNDDVTISGNLTVSGTTTYINTETVQIYDNIIDLNSNFTTGTPTENAGIRVLRGDEPVVLVRWNETTDKWQYTNDGSAYVDIVGTTSLGVTSLGNSATANYFTGNGSLLTSLTGANISGYVPNANIANTAYSVAVANVSGIGNIATINKDGNASNILYGNGVFASAPASSSYGNSNVATYLGSYGSNTITTTGNISVGNIIGNGQALTGLAGANVSGAVTYATTANAVAGANVSGAVTYATTANAVAGANVSGQVGNALLAGTVYTASQPNITSVGTLTDLSVSGNATITGNLTVSGTTTTINSTTVSVNDLNLVLANNASSASAANGAGITINGASANMNYINSTNSFTFSHKIVADGSLLTSLTGANVTGQVGNALLAGTVYTATQPNITSTGTLTSLTVSGSANFTGTTTFTSSQDVTVTGTPDAGVVAYNLYNGVVFDVTPSANWTANVSNIATTNNRTSVVTFIITQGVTPYVPNVFQIAGATQTVKWINGTTPSGTASKIDVVSYSMIRSSSGSWTVLGQSATYG